jgi:hypothetical protein
MAENQSEILETLEPLFTDMVVKWANHLHDKNTRDASTYLKKSLFDHYFTDVSVINRTTPNYVDKYKKYYKLTKDLILDLQWYVTYRGKGRRFNPKLYDLYIKVTSEDIKQFETYLKILSDTIKPHVNEHAAYINTKNQKHKLLRTLKRDIAKKITVLTKSIAATEATIRDLAEEKSELIRRSSTKPVYQPTLDLINYPTHSSNTTLAELVEVDKDLAYQYTVLEKYTKEVATLRLEANEVIGYAPSNRMNVGNNSNMNNVNGSRRRSRSRSRSRTASLIEGGTRKKKRTPK